MKDEIHTSPKKYAVYKKVNRLLLSFKIFADQPKMS